MKKIFCFMLIFSATTITFAQIRLTFTAGYSQSSIIEKNDIPGWQDTIKPNYSPLSSMNGGLKIDIPITEKNDFFFQSGVVYYTKGRKYFQVNDTAKYYASDSSFELRLGYIDLPFNLMYKKSLSKTIRVIASAGIYFSFLTNGKEKMFVHYKDTTIFANELSDLPVGKGPGKYKTANIGINALAGFELGRFSIIGGINKDITNMYRPLNHTGDLKNQVFSISIGYGLGIKEL